ncbi:MAG TPA: hypothetical protein VLA34_11495, partial [Candidatus Krumholzibacterium sp.]|nr:hypothetical protein [Candidatus Krumholzibacterium sp.]
MSDHMRLLVLILLTAAVCSCSGGDGGSIESDDIRAAGKIAGLEMTDTEIDTLLADVNDQLESYLEMRRID